MAMTALDHRQVLEALLPPGQAWPQDAETRLVQLLDALAAEFARVDQRGDDLVRESDPRTTAELLTDWERLLDLPGHCDELAPTLQERRNAVVSKLTEVGGQSRRFYIDLAAALGYTITITEFSPFRAGYAAAGDALTNDTWLHWWMVNVPAGTTVFPFSAGQSTAGEPLRSWGDERLECLIEALKPAHTNVSFSYGA